MDDHPLIPFVKDGSLLPHMAEGFTPLVRGNGLTRGDQGSNFPELEDNADTEDTDTPTPDRGDAAGVTENI